ncbi:CapA family protein [Neobacillus niacini]|uniref:CapA family protein n=1 Tax=Neobacillus niacini TaxID=86668 RepID=UPI001C8E85A6|nr:CapA family protein [Neobacillus niacini]MBY0145115.1 CapA family protein [Neobacillus niacini]
MATIFVCGDIVNYEKNDGLVCSDSLAEIIANADYSICNFEAPIEGFGNPISKSGPHHFQRKSTIKGLYKQGFDLLCMANNHIMDFGSKGLIATMEESKYIGLDSLGVGVDFNEAYKPLVKRINGIDVGLINASEAQFGVLDYFADKNQPGYAWINHSVIDNKIIELKKECDFVIVLSHAGLENYNVPQKEWRHRYKHLCDLGADIVVGSHPHVPQGYEQYNNSFIFYSLGNFYFDSKNYINKEDNSYSVLFHLEKNKQVKFEPIFHHKQDGYVQLSPIEKQIDLKQLNTNLGPVYDKLHDSMSLEAYNRQIKLPLFYSLLPIPYDGSMKSFIKNIVKALLGRERKDHKELQTLHFLRNEAYYYAARHALELITKGKQGRR